MEAIPESMNLGGAAILFEGIHRGKNTHQNQHDEPHSFLSVIGTVGEADARAGEHQQGSILDQDFHHDEQEGCHAKTDYG